MAGLDGGVVLAEDGDLVAGQVPDPELLVRRGEEDLRSVRRPVQRQHRALAERRAVEASESLERVCTAALNAVLMFLHTLKRRFNDLNLDLL